LQKLVVLHFAPIPIFFNRLAPHSQVHADLPLLNVQLHIGIKQDFDFGFKLLLLLRDQRKRPFQQVYPLPSLFMRLGQLFKLQLLQLSLLEPDVSVFKTFK
jgi:hypothetical protein